MRPLMVVLAGILWISGTHARGVLISDEEPKLVTVRLNIDDEEFRHLNDEEFEQKLLETLMSTLSKNQRDGHSFENPAIPGPEDEPSLDSWSVVWYIASFGGLIAFFLIISCSEWCCRKSRGPSTSCPRSSTSPPSPFVPETPPPSYDHFAPPSYDSLTGAAAPEKSDFDVFVVPVHAIGPMMGRLEGEEERRRDEPPSYADFRPAVERT